MGRRWSKWSPTLPSDRPRYLMGVGSPEDLVEGIARGVDMFDCVLPTRVARNGALFTAGRPATSAMPCSVLSRSQLTPAATAIPPHLQRAYLHHLFRAEELLAYRLASIHNLRFLIRLVERSA